METITITFEPLHSPPAEAAQRVDGEMTVWIEVRGQPQGYIVGILNQDGLDSTTLEVRSRAAILKRIDQNPPQSAFDPIYVTAEPTTAVPNQEELLEIDDSVGLQFLDQCAMGQQAMRGWEKARQELLDVLAAGPPFPTESHEIIELLRDTAMASAVGRGTEAECLEIAVGLAALGKYSERSASFRNKKDELANKIRAMTITNAWRREPATLPTAAR